jgi:hypothetical protein
MVRTALTLMVLAGSALAVSAYRAPGPVETALYLGTDGTGTLVEFNLQSLGVEVSPTAEFSEASSFSMPMESRLAVVGAPDLPVIRRMVRIPETGGIRLEVVSEETAPLGLYSVAPFQGYPNRDGSVNPYVIKDAIYSSSTLYPEAPVTLESIEILRDLRVAWITYNPVRINPVTGEAVITTSVTVRLINEGSGENELARVMPTFTRSYLPVYREVLGFDESERAAGDGCYLVITSDAGYAYTQDLIDWKRQKGWQVEFGSVPGIGSTSAAIDAYIENAFNTWEVPPEWVLIVGNETVVPPPYASGTAADNQYGVIGTGVNPSIHVGRLTGGDTENLTYQAWKIHSYESDPYQPASSWFQHGVSIGSTDFQDPWMSYRYAQIMRAHGMTVDVYCDNSTYGGTPPTIANLSAEINGGTSLISYIGHGSITSWVTTGFSNSNVNALTNGRLLPWISSIACNNSEFQGSTLCFSEAWMSYGSIASPKGAVGFMGATMSSPVGPTDSLANYQFRGYFEQELYHMGAAFDYGKIMAYQYTGSTSNSNMHMIMGCPEFDIFTETSPLPYIDADYPSSIEPGAWNVTATLGGSPVEGALVGVVQGEVLLARGYTNASGLISLTIPTIPTSDPVTVTVTVHNGYPFVGTATVGTGIGDGTSGVQDGLFLTSPAPSPFSSSSAFSYSLPSAGSASLAVYDLSGRIVSTLASGEQPAGIHSVVWDGADSSGAPVPDGIYIVRLTAGSGSLSRTCVVLR